MKYNTQSTTMPLVLGTVFAAFLSFCMLGASFAQTEDAGKPEGEKSEDPEKPQVTMSEDGTQLNLPGIKVLVKERYVDVDATVCLMEGLLELVACKKDSKEHESIIAIDAKAAHVHAALLLVGAKPGNPATRQFIEGEEEGTGRWVDYLPRGQNIDVYLVVNGEDGKPVERPISDFIVHDPNAYGYDTAQTDDKEKKVERFPTKTFLFAGSHIVNDNNGNPQYLADMDGNVISISTFGDELLCLPGINTKGNDGLEWAVDPTHLPELGSKITLRLRPQLAKAPEAGETEK